MKTSFKGAIVAGAVAGMFACSGGGQASSASAGDTASPVHCGGINACKGQGGCGGAGNACKGQNECKGKGWVETASADECTAQGGAAQAGE